MTTRPPSSLRSLTLALAALLILVPAAFGIAHKRGHQPRRPASHTVHRHAKPGRHVSRRGRRTISYGSRVYRDAATAQRETNKPTTTPPRRTTSAFGPAKGSTTSTSNRNPISADGASRSDCVYSANNIATLANFGAMVGHRFECAQVFSNANPDWSGWEMPWFLDDSRPDFDWQKWATAPGTHRQLIVTISPFPDSVAGTHWLRAGASGAFDKHARAFARNMIANGLGHAVIRLAHEANDSAYSYSLGDSPAEQSLWAQMWRHEALAMKSVPGAHFLMDWCINARYRAIPLANWYPGDRAVDIVGVDSYDSGVTARNRWDAIADSTDGLNTVIAFANAHRKPISLPEWGLAPKGGTSKGGGDDPTYLNGIASIVRANRVAYQSYFFNLDAAVLLKRSPRSLAAYRQRFGGGGEVAGSPTISG